MLVTCYQSFTTRYVPAPSSSIQVNISVTENGSYLAGAKPPSVTIPGGSMSAVLTLGTDDDEVVEADGSVSVTVQTGTGYVLGAAGTETVTIQDNDPPVVDPTRPGKVSLPTATRGGDGSAPVSWDAPSNGGSAITRYEVQYKVTTDSSWTGATPVAVTSATLSDLDGNAYHVQVRACNAVGCGAWSDSATIPSIPTVTMAFTAFPVAHWKQVWSSCRS